MTGIIIAAAIIFTVLLISFVCYRIAFYSPNRSQNDIYNIPKAEQYQKHRGEMIRSIDELAALPFEQVYITSRDRLRLAGRYYHVKDGAPIAICFHGYRAAAIRDFCGGLLFYMERGINILLVDQRAQGLSEGHTITFGAKEKLDCLDWIKYAVDRFGKDSEIFLFGISMGAATVLLSAGEGLPQNVRAVVADSPYSSAKGILKKVCGDMKLPSVIAYPFLWLGAAVFGNFKIENANVISALSNASAPILIVHGEDDRFVPCDMSRRMKAAYPEKIRLETFPGAGHGISYMTDKARYKEIVTELIDGSERS